jgi:hypothetical protein
MSFDEMGVLLKAANEKEKREWEKNRLGWFYSLIAPGMSKAKKPTDLIKFDWEKDKKETKKTTKEQIDKRVTQVEKWLNNK